MSITGGILRVSLAFVSGFNPPGKGLRTSAHASLTAMHGYPRAYYPTCIHSIGTSTLLRLDPSSSTPHSSLGTGLEPVNVP